MTSMAYQLAKNDYKFVEVDIDDVFGFKSADEICHPTGELKTIVKYIKESAKFKSEGYFLAEGIRPYIALWSKVAYDDLTTENCFYLSTTLAASLRYKVSDNEVEQLAHDTLKIHEGNPVDESTLYHDPYRRDNVVKMWNRPNVYPEMKHLIIALKEAGVTPFVIDASQEKFAVELLDIPVDMQNVYGTKKYSAEKMLSGKGVDIVDNFWNSNSI